MMGVGRVAAKSKSKRKPASAKRVSRTRRPEEMSVETWQRELRRQYGTEQSFELENRGEQPIFSDFVVTNPESRTSYRVAIRATEPGRNFCSCGDFTTNALGTCKHIEFTLSRLAAKRGGRKALREGWSPPYSSVSVEYGPQRHVRIRIGSDAPPKLKKIAAEWFGSDGRLLAGRLERLDEFVAKAREADPDLRVYDDVIELMAEARDARRREALVDESYGSAEQRASLDDLLRVPLYEYQKEGALFALRAGRSLIGDEMGLGKTIQAIAASELMARHLGVERVLIICPTSLKHQWESEIESFSTRGALVVGGLRRRRAEIFAESSFYKITNYDTVYRDLDLIESWSPDLVILDEAQRIKNWATRTAKHVKRISSPYAIVLTGTPLENRLEELVSIIDFIDPFRLGPTFQFLHQHQIRDEHGRVVGYTDLDQVSKALESVVIRRRKREVLQQLPERIESSVFVTMTPQQRRHHEENRETVARIVARWRKYGHLGDRDQRVLMIALQNMRMSCDSTWLLDRETDHGTKADEAATLIEELLEEEETKVVVFSQWLGMHEVLERRFPRNGWDYVFFHGGVASPKRKELIRRFREDDRCRVFLSTDAGGVGLNLQRANVVMNLDLPWNPAVLEQRIGRVHRIGQRRPVRIVNFVAEGTIEHGMLSVLRFKKSLFAGVLDGGEREVFLGGTRLKRFLEGVEAVSSRIPVPPPPEESSKRETAVEDEEDRRAMDTAIVEDPFQQILQAGVALLQKMASPQAASQAAGTLGRVEVVEDESTGERYMKMPVPNREAVEKLAGAVAEFLKSLE
jgi:superfamily II DNA or RNA helicase